MRLNRTAVCKVFLDGEQIGRSSYLTMSAAKGATKHDARKRRWKHPDTYKNLQYVIKTYELVELEEYEVVYSPTFR